MNNTTLMNFLAFLSGVTLPLAVLFLYTFFKKAKPSETVVIKVEVDSKAAMLNLKELEEVVTRIQEKVKIIES